MPSDKKVLLEAGDGPEGIEIYTSDERGVVDWSDAFPAVYVSISIWGANALFGPFRMAKIHQDLARQIKEPNV